MRRSVRIASIASLLIGSLVSVGAAPASADPLNKAAVTNPDACLRPGLLP